MTSWRLFTSLHQHLRKTVLDLTQNFSSCHAPNLMVGSPLYDKAFIVLFFWQVQADERVDYFLQVEKKISKSHLAYCWMSSSWIEVFIALFCHFIICLLKPLKLMAVVVLNWSGSVEFLFNWVQLIQKWSFWGGLC